MQLKECQLKKWQSADYWAEQVWTEKEGRKLLSWDVMANRWREEFVDLCARKIMEFKNECKVVPSHKSIASAIDMMTDMVLFEHEVMCKDGNTGKMYLPLDELPPAFFYYFWPVVHHIQYLKLQALELAFRLERERASRNPRMVRLDEDGWEYMEADISDEISYLDSPHDNNE
jgi:hypothetical protein